MENVHNVAHACLVSQKNFQDVYENYTTYLVNAVRRDVFYCW